MKSGDRTLRLAPAPASRKKRKRGGGKKAIRIIFLTVILGLLIYYGHAFFKIEDVVVKGAGRLEPSEVVAVAGVREGTSIWWISETNISKRLLLIPAVASVSVSRRLPATVVIEIREREPAAYLVCGETYWVVDREGVVFDTARSLESGRPVVTGVPDDEIVAGSQLGCPARAASLQDFLAAHGSLPDLYVAELNLEDPEAMLLYTVDGKKILLGCSEKMERKLKLVCKSLPYIAGSVQSVLLDVRTGDRLVVVTGSNPVQGEVVP